MSLCMPQLPCKELLSSRGISLPVMVMVKTTWYSAQPRLLLPVCLLSCYPTLLQPSAAGQWIVFTSPTGYHLHCYHLICSSLHLIWYNLNIEPCSWLIIWIWTRGKSNFFSLQCFNSGAFFSSFFASIPILGFLVFILLSLNDVSVVVSKLNVLTRVWIIPLRCVFSAQGPLIVAANPSVFCKQFWQARSQ